MCNSVGPCSRHRKLHISEINSNRGQISKIICNSSGNEFPHIFGIGFETEMPRSLTRLLFLALFLGLTYGTQKEHTVIVL